MDNTSYTSAMIELESDYDQLSLADGRWQAFDVVLGYIKSLSPEEQKAPTKRLFASNYLNGLKGSHVFQKFSAARLQQVHNHWTENSSNPNAELPLFKAFEEEAQKRFEDEFNAGDLVSTIHYVAALPEQTRAEYQERVFSSPSYQDATAIELRQIAKEVEGSPLKQKLIDDSNAHYGRLIGDINGLGLYDGQALHGKFREAVAQCSVGGRDLLPEHEFTFWIEQLQGTPYCHSVPKTVWEASVKDIAPSKSVLEALHFDETPSLQFTTDSNEGGASAAPKEPEDKKDDSSSQNELDPFDPYFNPSIAQGMQPKATESEKDNAWMAIGLRLENPHATDAQKEQSVLDAMLFLQKVKRSGWTKDIDSAGTEVIQTATYQGLSSEALDRILAALHEESLFTPESNKIIGQGLDPKASAEEKTAAWSVLLSRANASSRIISDAQKEETALTMIDFLAVTEKTDPASTTKARVEGFMATGAYQKLPDETNLVLLQPLAKNPEAAPSVTPAPTEAKPAEAPVAPPASAEPPAKAKATPAKVSKRAVSGSEFSFKWAVSAGAIGGLACAYFFAAPLAILGTVLFCFFGGGVAGGSSTDTPKKVPQKTAPASATEKAPKKSLAKRLGGTAFGRFLQKSFIGAATAAMAAANYLDPNHEAAPKAPRKSVRERISNLLGSPKAQKLGAVTKVILGRGAYIGLGAIGVLAYQGFHKTQATAPAKTAPVVAAAATTQETPVAKAESNAPVAKTVPEAPVQIEGLAVTGAPKVQEHSDILLGGAPLFTLDPTQSWQDLSAPIVLKPFDFTIKPMVELDIPAAPEVPEIPQALRGQTPEEALGIPALIQDDFSDIDFTAEEPTAEESASQTQPTGPEKSPAPTAEAAPQAAVPQAAEAPASAPAPKRNAASLAVPASTLLDNVVVPGMDPGEPEAGAVILGERPSASISGTVRGALHDTRTFMTGDPNSHAGALGTVGTGADRLVVGTCRTTGHAIRYVGKAFWHGVCAVGEAVSSPDAAPATPSTEHNK